MSRKDTLAWRAHGRGRGVLGPEEMGEAVHRVWLFSEQRMVLSPQLVPGRGLLRVGFLQGPGVGAGLD